MEGYKMSHPKDTMLADYLDDRLPPIEKKKIEEHIASCDECLNKVVSAYESVRSFDKNAYLKRKGKSMGKINIYLIAAIISFALSFITPRFFLQFLVATLLLGAKWVADSKSTKMLVMIHEAWKNGGEREASEVIKRFDSDIKPAYKRKTQVF
jgi:hypothetical protein